MSQSNHILGHIMINPAHRPWADFERHRYMLLCIDVVSLHSRRLTLCTEFVLMLGLEQMDWMEWSKRGTTETIRVVMKLGSSGQVGLEDYALYDLASVCTIYENTGVPHSINLHFLHPSVLTVVILSPRHNPPIELCKDPNTAVDSVQLLTAYSCVPFSHVALVQIIDNRK